MAGLCPCPTAAAQEHEHALSLSPDAKAPPYHQQVLASLLAGCTWGKAVSLPAVAAAHILPGISN